MCSRLNRQACRLLAQLEGRSLGRAEDGGDGVDARREARQIHPNGRAAEAGLRAHPGEGARGDRRRQDLGSREAAADTAQPEEADECGSGGGDELHIYGNTVDTRKGGAKTAPYVLRRNRQSVTAMIVQGHTSDSVAVVMAADDAGRQLKERERQLRTKLSRMQAERKLRLSENIELKVGNN